MLLLYTAGLYLIFVGVFALVNDANIYIGFLWVIDLGVVLVFFIVILHFTSFLFQKSQFNLTASHFLFGYLITAFVGVFTYCVASSSNLPYYHDLSKTWFSKLSYFIPKTCSIHVDDFSLLHTSEVTDLNTLSDTCSLPNSLEVHCILILCIVYLSYYL